MHKLFIVSDIMSVSHSAVQALYSLMPEDRQIRCDRYRLETDRRLSVLSYSLLLHTVHTEYGATETRLEYGPDGKPYLADMSGVHFNLSHCNQGIALILSSEPVGVDIEAFESYDEKLIDMTMSGEESALIRSSEDSDIAFIQLWTRKEALVKYTGKGLEDDVRDILEQHKEAHIRTFVDRSMGCAISVCAKSEFEDGFTPRYMSAADLCHYLTNNSWM